VQAHENKLSVTLMPLNNDQIEKERNLSLICYMKTNLAAEECTRLVAKFVKQWPGWSPTVNISWFIAKAYLANLYYTTQRDVNLIKQTCDDIIHVYGESFWNKSLAERTFPVVLSTQWTCIYDKEIQQVLGFFSLCSYVLDKCSSRSVHLGVCPVQFALYVKLRTEQRHGFSAWIINKYTDDCNQHMKTCRFDDGLVKIGMLILLKAYNIGKKSYG